MVKVQKGTLISSDEATITFLLLLDERSVGSGKFIIDKLDTRTLLVKSDKVPQIKEKLAERLASTMWDDGDEAAGQPYGAQP